MKEKITNPSSGFNIRVDAIPTATKPPSIVNWKIIPQLGQKFVYQIIRADGYHKIYMSFGSILKDFSRDDLTELFKLVIKKYGANRPEEAYDRVLWGDLKTMFDPPLSEDAIWSLPLQQKMLRWRQKISSIKGCLPSYAEYEALRRCKEQTATGKEISNPLIADSLLKTISCDAEVDDADKDLKTKPKSKNDKVRVNTEESAVKPEPELKNTIECNLNPSDGPGKPNSISMKTVKTKWALNQLQQPICVQLTKTVKTLKAQS
ncbi:hypothetical protein Tco_0949523 [Tanacetum coccineum]